MSDLASLLQASLLPATRKQAEQSLNSLSSQEGFLPHLLQLVLDQATDLSVRLAGSIYLKNLAKLRWDEVNGDLHFYDYYQSFNLPRRERMWRPFQSKIKPFSAHNLFLQCSFSPTRQISQ